VCDSYVYYSVILCLCSTDHCETSVGSHDHYMWAQWPVLARLLADSMCVVETLAHHSALASYSDIQLSINDQYSVPLSCSIPSVATFCSAAGCLAISGTAVLTPMALNGSYGWHVHVSISFDTLFCIPFLHLHSRLCHYSDIHLMSDRRWRYC